MNEAVLLLPLYAFMSRTGPDLLLLPMPSQMWQRPKTQLTLRQLMLYIYIYIYIYMEHLFLMFLDHTQRRTTVGRTPLDE